MDLNNKVGSVYNLSRVFFQLCKNNLAGNLKDNVVVPMTVSLKLTAAVLARVAFLHQQWQRTNVDSFIT